MSENELLIRRLYREGINRQDAAAAAEHYAERALNHGRAVGSAGMRLVFESLFATFPDVHYELLELTPWADRVAIHAVMTGTHLGEPTLSEMFQGMLRDVRPTGRAVRVEQMHGFRIADGLIAEHEAVRDDLGLLLQLGLVPPRD